ncbi:helix-turn-helix domain-containing protein [Autumnicola musiva]|uniref:Helix-turn-helix transcriptional regulator n=1 Tax=Autumnicola musiva TaxID=3075589 RepID=A0ABU3D7G1_9FLAO|nr:helix-turn-helix transcriptional regulator [Zunongwangia sp. F117]MDT0677300.1 helix-turn-helix transcriptional regulator [Zunongwangia sp. F117]
MSTGKNIATIRILKGLKQDALARIMGLNQNSISVIENKNKVDDDLLIKVADALQVTVYFIINFDRTKMFEVINEPEKQVLKISKKEDTPLNLEAKVIELYKRLVTCKKNRL